MFVDLIGYTSLSERMDPEDLRAIQGRYQQLVLVTVERFGGFVANLQGDGVLAYFGYPAAHENDAERAVRAGLELVERVAALDSPPLRASGATLAVRIGINSGLAVIGPELVSAGQFEHGAVGESVNIASRVQAKAPPNGVAITSDTLELVQGLFEVRRLGARSLRGLTRKVVVYHVTAALPGTKRIPGPLAYFKAPMIGRDACLETLLKEWSIVRSGNRCRTVHVFGEAGLGKTRLLREFCGRPELSRAVIAQVHCQEIFSSTPLYPVASFLWSRLGLTVEDDEETRREKIMTGLREFGLLDAEHVQIVEGFIDMARTGHGDGFARSPELFRRKQYDFVRAVLAQAANRSPTILWVEDVHWLDPSSAELLQQLVTELRDKPLLVVVTSRSFPRGPALPPADETVVLRPLEPAECRELALTLPGAKRLPDQAVAHAIDVADGVPLFVEQVIVSCIDEQDQRGRGSGRKGKLSLLLAEILSERLDRRPGGRRIVQAAACIGRSFRPNFLTALLREEIGDLAQPLEALVEAEILLPRRYGAEIHYEFRHSLLQRVAYESMVQNERVAIHARIVEVLREQDQDLPTAPEVMAYHLTQALLYPQAVQSWLSAGVSAARRSAYAESLDHLRSGQALLDHIPDVAERRALELQLLAALMGSIVAVQGATSLELAACCERGLQLCAEGGPTPLVFPFVFGQFTFYNCRGRIDEASRCATLFLSLAERNAYPSGQVIGHRLCGMVGLGRGDAALACEHLERSLAIYTPERDAASTHLFGQDAAVHNRSLLALALFCKGDVQRALEVGREALTAADALRHPHSTAIALCYVGAWIFGLCDAVEDLHREAARLVELSAQHGLGGFRGHGAGFLGWALCRQGRLQEGIAMIESGIAELDRIEYRLAVAGFLGNLADALRETGQVERAATVSRRALDLVVESSCGWLEPELLRIDALIAGAAGDREAAVSRLRRAAGRAAEMGSPVLLHRCRRSLRELGASADPADAGQSGPAAAFDDLADQVRRMFRA